MSRKQVETALKVLRAADLQGLRASDYAVQIDPDRQTAEDQARLASVLVRYARDVRLGRMAPDAFPSDWGIRPVAWNPAPDLAAAVAADRLGPWLDSLPPGYSGYHALKRGLERYRGIADAGGWKPLAEGPPIALGAKGPQVIALRARLAAEDPKAPNDASPVFDAELQKAVIRAQRRLGMKPDGIVGAPTRAALNQPVGQRILQIAANMERWRWMPDKMPATRIQVNSGAAIVTLFKDDVPVLSMRAVSGKVGDETPLLASQIHSVVLNPPWNVPSSIATKELWPKEKSNPGYLARNGFKVISTDGGGRRLQQQAGDQSSLGRYKFDFENPYAVYLHDTPAKAGFDRFARQASHGCVRLEKPGELTAALLADDPAWTPQAIQAAVESGQTQRVRLKVSVPVYILYWTAFASADGQMNFRSDPYGWDRMLLQKVGVLGAQV